MSAEVRELAERLGLLKDCTCDNCQISGASERLPTLGEVLDELLKCEPIPFSGQRREARWWLIRLAAEVKEPADILPVALRVLEAVRQ